MKSSETIKTRESRWVREVSPGEYKWIQVSPEILSDSKWFQVHPSESKWVQVNQGEYEGTRVIQVSSNWVQVRLRESKW